MCLKLKRLAIAMAALLPSLAFANGFQVWPQSGSAAGDLAAGAAASQTNVDSAYYNPATLSYFKHQVAGFSALGLFQSYKFDGSVTTNPTVTNFTDNSGTAQGGNTLILPSIMYVAPISGKWAFGLAVISPERMSINYGTDEFTRYSAIKQSFNTYDISPSLSYKVMPKLSFGLGFDAIYAHERYEQTVTNTSIANDSNSTSKTSGWGFGWHFGAFWKATQTTNVGVSFHSGVTINGSGSSKLTGPLGDLSSRAKSNIELPPMTIFSVQQMLGKQWTVLASAVYNEWGQTGDFTLKHIATTAGEQNLTLVDKLQNSWTFLLGAHYQVSSKVMLKGALGYDQSPVKKAYYSLLFPNKDQIMAAIGLRYQFAPKFAADIGFTHYFDTNTTINHSQTTGNMTATATGNLHYNASVIGLELEWQMT